MLSKEMKMVYDYCCKQQSRADKNLDALPENSDFILTTNLVATGTAFWQVKQFIEVNFMEEE